jgi:hypothetical protein
VLRQIKRKKRNKKETGLKKNQAPEVPLVIDPKCSSLAVRCFVSG